MLMSKWKASQIDHCPRSRWGGEGGPVFRACGCGGICGGRQPSKIAVSIWRFLINSGSHTKRIGVLNPFLGLTEQVKANVIN